MKGAFSGSFLKGAKNYFFADAFSSALAFITVPVFTRFLTPSDYGIMAVFTSGTTLLSMLLGMGVYSSISRRYYEADSDFENYLGSIVFFQLLASAVFAGALWTLRPQFIRFLCLPDSLFTYFIAAVFFRIFIQLGFMYLRTSRDSKNYSSLSVFQCATAAFFGICFVVNLDTNRYMGKVYAELLVGSIVLCIFLRGFFRIAGGNFNVSI